MIAVQITKNFQGISVSPSKIEKLVKAICNWFKLSNATVSIAIVDDAQMRKVNAQFTNRKSTTDCLSFDLSDEKTQNSKLKTQNYFEIVVNGELTRREAGSRGHSGEAELALYITHGLLHNLGFDDSTKRLAKKMHDTEDQILQKFGYGLVYDKNRY